MEKLEYIIEDRTIAEVLGVQNFTNEESAVLELVKNAFDAQAKEVYITISKDEMIVEDNGKGMNRQKIFDAWMHVGKSDKDYDIGSENDKRILAGSKGVGRFALARLGERVVLTSKMINEKPIAWKTDWNSSTLEELEIEVKQGTKIVIEKLRDNWTASRVNNMKDFLSRTYNDDVMKIFVEYKADRREVKKYFNKFELGIHGVSLIKLNYNSMERELICRIESDEFEEKAKEKCSGLNLKEATIKLDISDELEDMKDILVQEDVLSDEKLQDSWNQLLSEVGDFSAELYFSPKSVTTIDKEKFCYKYKILPERYETGVILYRNSFSISSYEGKKDWLEFGKRSRISPAAATHPTGAWRVRENQISGKVIIDKKENYKLCDLTNRQGLVENDTYKVFVRIIIAGINCFERYRQNIIRTIDKLDKEENPKKPKMLEKVLKNPDKLNQLSVDERQELVDELKEIKKENRESRKQMDEVEKKYKYDIRLLNVLATSGLKATSIAHEMHNKRNSIDENVGYIVEALKRYELWDIVDDPENKRFIHRNIPGLLQKNQRLNKKMITFMDVMLSETEKEQFIPEEVSVTDLFEDIKRVWQKDYSWISIELEIEEGLLHKSAKDIFRVIFDNLILNSIQQNDQESLLRIRIRIVKKGKMLYVEYFDNGKGLNSKYLVEPRRILEVHETSRKGGHGIGMWIVNNTITGTSGEIQEIDGKDGFKIKFTLGEKV